MVECQLPKLNVAGSIPVPRLKDVAMNIRNICFVFLGSLCLFVYGCAAPSETIRTEPTPVLKRQGIYHKVEPKETLWRISKAYNISVDELVKANNIPDAAHIQENQLIFIPNATAEKPVVSTDEAFQSDDFKWPIKGRVVSYFGDTRNAWAGSGIEIRPDEAQKVFPSRGGEVIFADYLNGYGHTAILSHQDGYQTVYARNASLLVSVGEYVTSQVPIAVVGGDGSFIFLHFEIRKDSTPKNPLHFLP